MAILENINSFFDLLIEAFRSLSKLRVWVLLTAYFLLLWFILYAHYAFNEYFFSSIIIWWVKLLDSIGGTNDATAFTHYPAHLYLLSEKFNWAKTVVALFAEGLVLGAVARTIGSKFYRSGIPNKRSLIGDWFHLALAWLVVNLLTLVLGTYLPELALPFLDGPRRVQAFSYLFMPGVYVAVFSLFVFTLPSIAVRGDNILEALLRSFKTFFKHPVTCVILAAIVLSGPILFSIINGYSRVIVDSFRPELVYWLLVAGLVVETAANFIWMSTTVRFIFEQDR